MPVGPTARRVLGPHLFQYASHVYRSIFVDLELVAKTMSHHLPPQAHLVDVGGGDGAPLNPLLDVRPDVSVTMIDLAKNIGGGVEPRHAGRVRMLPGTSLRDYRMEPHQ